MFCSLFNSCKLLKCEFERTFCASFSLKCRRCPRNVLARLEWHENVLATPLATPPDQFLTKNTEWPRCPGSGSRKPGGVKVNDTFLHFSRFFLFSLHQWNFIRVEVLNFINEISSMKFHPRPPPYFHQWNFINEISSACRFHQWNFIRVHPLIFINEISSMKFHPRAGP